MTKVELAEACYLLCEYYKMRGLLGRDVVTCGMGKDEIVVYLAFEIDDVPCPFMGWPVRAVITGRPRPASA